MVFGSSRYAYPDAYSYCYCHAYGDCHSYGHTYSDFRALFGNQS